MKTEYKGFTVAKHIQKQNRNTWHRKRAQAKNNDNNASKSFSEENE